MYMTVTLLDKEPKSPGDSQAPSTPKLTVYPKATSMYGGRGHFIFR